MKIPRAVDETAIDAYCKAVARSPRWACRDESTRGTASSSRRRCWAAPIWRRHGDRRRDRRSCPASSWCRFIDGTASRVTVRLQHHLVDDRWSMDRTVGISGEWSVVEIGKERDSRGCSARSITHEQRCVPHWIQPGRTREQDWSRLSRAPRPDAKPECGRECGDAYLGARVLAVRIAMSHICQNHVRLVCASDQVRFLHSIFPQYAMSILSLIEFFC